jgi:hypothetical protein
LRFTYVQRERARQIRTSKSEEDDFALLVAGFWLN